MAATWRALGVLTRGHVWAALPGTVPRPVWKRAAVGSSPTTAGLCRGGSRTTSFIRTPVVWRLTALSLLPCRCDLPRETRVREALLTIRLALSRSGRRPRPVAAGGRMPAAGRGRPDPPRRRPRRPLCRRTRVSRATRARTRASQGGVRVVSEVDGIPTFLVGGGGGTHASLPLPRLPLVLPPPPLTSCRCVPFHGR